MRQLFAALVLVLTSLAPLEADPICFESNPCRYVAYEHAFDLEEERTYTRDDLFNSGPMYGAPAPHGLWSVPAFDFSLGNAEVLYLEIEGTLTIRGQIHDLDGNAEVKFWTIAAALSIHDLSWMNGVGGASVTCTAAPCDFLGEGPFGDAGWVLPNADKTGWDVPPWLTSDLPGITMPIALYSPDTFFTLRTPLGEFEDYAFTPLTIRTELTGIARATYLYEPFAEPIPEPATMTLLGTGLAAMFLRSRRNKRTGQQ